MITMLSEIYNWDCCIIMIINIISIMNEIVINDLKIQKSQLKQKLKTKRSCRGIDQLREDEAAGGVKSKVRKPKNYLKCEPA